MQFLKKHFKKQVENKMQSYMTLTNFMAVLKHKLKMSQKKISQ